METKEILTTKVIAAKCEVCGDFPLLIAKPHFFVQCSCGCVTQYRDNQADAITDWLMNKVYKRKGLRYNALMALYGFQTW
jgi:hypothetical protein